MAYRVERGLPSPGPWKVEKPYGNGMLCVVSGADKPVHKWRFVAIISTDRASDNDPMLSEAEANAQVLAMAPELLTAVKEAARIFRQYEGWHLEKGTPEGNRKAEVNGSYALRMEQLVERATEVKHRVKAGSV